MMRNPFRLWPKRQPVVERVVTINSLNKPTDSFSVMRRHQRFTSMLLSSRIEIVSANGAEMTLRGKSGDMAYFLSMFEVLDTLGQV